MLKKLRIQGTENTIQGLYQPQGACQSFWTLLAKIELAIFREAQKKEENEHEKT